MPNEISKIAYDERELCKQIKNVWEGLYGTSYGLEPPFKAFEVIVRNQVLDLEKPITVCVDAVIGELSNAVRICTQRVSALKFNLVCSIFYLIRVGLF